MGRRRELRRTVRVLRDDPRSVETEGWRAGASLVTHRDSEISRLGGFLLQPELADEARLQILGTLLSGHKVLLVLDNFEDNLTLAGTAFLGSTTGTVLETLYKSADSGKILLTCRYPVPGAGKVYARRSAWRTTLQAKGQALIRTKSGNQRSGNADRW